MGEGGFHPTPDPLSGRVRGEMQALGAVGTTIAVWAIMTRLAMNPREVRRALRSCMKLLFQFALFLSVANTASSQTAERVEQNRLADGFKRFNQLLGSGQLKEAEQLARELLPTPASEPKKQPGDLEISLYGLTWGRVAAVYAAREDYANAERIFSERVNAAEQVFGPDHMGVAVFLDGLGSIYLAEAKYGAALPVFRRSLKIHAAAKMDTAIIAATVYAGLAEALLADGKAEEALDVLKPVIEKARVGIVERSVFNAYAVVLREIGDAPGAEQLEREIDKGSFLREGVNEQERELLTARILTERGSPEKAELIYQRWIGHWEEWGDQIGKDPKDQEWDRILMQPLSEYLRFLRLQKRDVDAAAARSRLTSINAKYEIKSVQ